MIESTLMTPTMSNPRFSKHSNIELLFLLKGSYSVPILLTLSLIQANGSFFLL